MLDASRIDARQRTVEDALSRFARVAITGGPRTGKTLLAMAFGQHREVFHTDAWKGVEWDKQPALIVAACTGRSRFLLEGVQVPRAMRKGLELDALIWLDEPAAEQSAGQRSMGKAVATVLASFPVSIPILYPDRALEAQQENHP